MISLLFRFFGDSTPLRQEAEKAKKDMGKAGADIGKEFGSQIKGAIMSTVGIGAIISGMKQAFAEISEAQKGSAASGLGIKETLALERAAKATGLTTEQILSVAKERPSEFAGMISQFESSLGENDLKNIAAAGSAAKSAWSWLVDQTLLMGTRLGNQARGLVQSIGGSVIGDEQASVEGRFRLMTGMSPSAMSDPAPIRFAKSATEIERSNAAFNEMVDAVNRQIEETRKVREAVEKN